MTGIQEIFEIAGTKGMKARVTVTETYDALANTSDLQIGVEVASDTYGGHIYYLSGTVAADGQTLQSMSAAAGHHYVYVQHTNHYYPIASSREGYTGSPWSVSGIVHNTDGSKRITVNVSLSGQESSGAGADGWTLTGAKEVALTHIPRASTVAATDAVVGAVSMVAVRSKSSHYRHSIAYQFGQLQGYLTPGGLSEQEVVFADTAVAFLLPESFYYQIPDSKTGQCTLTCRTYWEDAQVGDPQSCVFTVGTDDASCAPLVSGTVEDVNPTTLLLTGDGNVLVRYASSALCTIAAQGRKGATLAEKKIDSLPVSANTYTLGGIERDVVVFSARDSRGYTATATVQKPMVPYVRLSCNVTAKRTDPTSGNVALEVTGDYYAGSFGAQVNELRLHCRVGNDAWVEVIPQIQRSSYSARLQLSGLDYTQSHTLQVRAADKLQTVTKSVTVGKGIPVFDWGENDFAFHVPVRLAGLPQLESDAVTKAYADGKLSLVKLWENPNPGEPFPAQTVEANLSGCAFVFCAAIHRTAGTEYQLSSMVANASGNSGQIHSFRVEGGDFWLSYRGFTLRYNGVWFDKAWVRDMAGGTVHEDWQGQSVPVAIYGLKSNRM